MPDDVKRIPIDKSRLPSRHVTVGPQRAPPRSYPYAMGLTHAQIAPPLVGVMMAMLRLNVPSVFMYGGSILPGRFKGKDVTVQDVFEAVGAHNAGTMSDEDLHELECVAC